MRHPYAVLHGEQAARVAHDACNWQPALICVGKITSAVFGLRRKYRHRGDQQFDSRSPQNSLLARSQYDIPGFHFVQSVIATAAS